ncbi:hypothetical protein ACYOEI_02750 [Singulisphaera rosea]
MTLRFKIRDILLVTALVALFVGLFAPELRAWDRSTLLFFEVLGFITTILLVSFTPVWVMLLVLRRRSRRGLAIDPAKRVTLILVAFASGFGILLAIVFAIRVMTAR